MASDDRQLTLRTIIDDAGLVAEVVIEPETNPAAITPELIVASLLQVGVEVRDAGAVQYSEAAKAARELAAQGGRVVAARGIAPDHGSNGLVRFEDGIDPTPDGRRASVVREIESAAASRVASRADSSHYDRSVFLLVTPGQHVATLLPPVPGTEGRDVRGHPLPCKLAAPMTLTVDATLSMTSDGTIRANVDGIIFYAPPRLYLQEDIDIAGSVDFSTGKVISPRDVRVRKSVRSYFSVTAKRDVRIGGVVEAATLSAGRDAMLDGGMAAQEKGRIEVGRDLHARYLDNVTASAGRDVEVDREMVNCQLSVGRSLRAGRAAMAGGSITIGGAAEIGVLGSDSAKTSITLGSLPALSDALAAARRMLPMLHERVAKAEARLAQIKGVKGKLSHVQAEELTELEFGCAEARGKSDRLSAKIAKLCEVLTRLTTVELVVQHRIHSRTLVYVDDLVADFHTDVEGPVRLDYGPNGRLQLTELSSKAVVDLKSFAKVTVDTSVMPFRGRAA